MSEVIGVDLGGTKIAIARLSGNELSESRIEATDRSGSEALLDQLAEMIDSCRGDELDGVGLGVPSVVDFESGRVVSSVNIPLVDVPLREVLGDRVGVPVFVDNDATVAALAEAHDENLKMVARDLVMITIGTGVGGGLVLGGRIYRGATGGAGEIGHTLVGLDLDAAAPAPDHFPQTGSLEAMAAGHALDRLTLEFADQHRDSALGRMRAAGTVSGVQAVDLAGDGDPDAAHLIELWGARVGIGIANAINTFDPRRWSSAAAPPAPVSCCWSPLGVRPAVTCFPAWASARRSASLVTVSGPECWEPPLLAVHEIADKPAPSPTEVIS